MARACRCRAILALRLEPTPRLGRPPPGLGAAPANETWSRRWWNLSHRGLSTSARSLTPTLSSMLSKEQQNYKEAKESRDPKDVRQQSKSEKDTKGTKHAKESKEARDPKKDSQTKSAAVIEPEVFVEYHRGLPRIVVPLPSRVEKCMFTLKPITQTVGDFLLMLKEEDPAIVKAFVTSPDGTKMAVTNRIETMLLDDFNLVINENIYPVTPPLQVERPKENLRQLQDLQALVNQLHETFNAREYQAELEREVMLQLEEVRVELEPLEELRTKIEVAAARRSHLASWGILVLMSIQFGCLARLTWWEYSWDIMEPVTYFVTYATAVGCYVYFLITKQEYMLPEVFRREHLIGLHKKAKKVGFDLARYNQLKEEAYELETMLKLIRGPLHIHQCIVEKKRHERLSQMRSRSSSSSSSSRSRSRSPSSSPSPSPSPERSVEPKHERREHEREKAKLGPSAL